MADCYIRHYVKKRYKEDGFILDKPNHPILSKILVNVRSLIISFIPIYNLARSKKIIRHAENIYRANRNRALRLGILHKKTEESLSQSPFEERSELVEDIEVRNAEGKTFREMTIDERIEFLRIQRSIITEGIDDTINTTLPLKGHDNDGPKI